jgi:hypothetical protein
MLTFYPYLKLTGPYCIRNGTQNETKPPIFDHSDILVILQRFRDGSQLHRQPSCLFQIDVFSLRNLLPASPRVPPMIQIF